MRSLSLSLTHTHTDTQSICPHLSWEHVTITSLPVYLPPSNRDSTVNNSEKYVSSAWFLRNQLKFHIYPNSTLPGRQWLWPPRLLCPWDSLSENTGMGSHSLLQGIFPAQGSNPCFLHCRQILYHLKSPGKPQRRYTQGYNFRYATVWDKSSEKLLNFYQLPHL